MKIRGHTNAIVAALAFIAPLTQAAIPADVAALMDTSADPCEDFYQYSCGTWAKDTTIPPSSTYTDASNTIIDKQTQAVIERLAKEKWPYVSDFYVSCMNTAQLDKLGAKPLEKQLDSILKVKDLNDLMTVAGQERRGGNSFITDLSVSGDLMNASINVVWAGAAKLVLPDPSYYFDNETFSELETPYRTYVSSVLKLAGFAPGGKYQQTVKRPNQQQQGKPTVLDLKTLVDKIIGVEQALAPLIPSTDGDDYSLYYHPLSFAEAQRKYPLTIGKYAAGMGFTKSSALKLSTMLVFNYFDYFDAVETLLKTIDVLDLKLYLAYSYIHSNVRFLSSSFYQAYFEFFAKLLRGQKEIAPRNEYCVQREIDFLPDAIGNYYFSKMFDQVREDNAKLMVKLIEAAMDDHISKLDWLDAPTRAAAEVKLGKVANLIGHSTEPIKFPFQFKTDAFLNNIALLDNFGVDVMIKSIGQPVNRNLWGMSAAEVNAYYSPSENKMVFPAAILQPPFFNGTYHPAQNFGGIGAVVGHELTHGFDSSGRHFDGDGNYRNWWSNSTAAEFEKRAQCMKDEYSAFVIYGEDGKPLGNVNGDTTIGENIADNGGTSLAWDAYRQYMKTATNVNTRGVLPDEADKLFFIAYGQSWCAKRTDGSTVQLLQGDPHAPSIARVNGVVMNSVQFASTFQCKAGSKMNPAKKCELW